MADLSYQVTVNTQQAQQSLQKLQGQINATQGVMRAFGTALATVTAGLGVREIITASSAWTDLNSRLRNATGSSAGAAAALEAITNTARSTYTSIELTSAAFLRNAQTLNALGLTTQQQINISEALNNALAISGTTGQQAESVMTALSKAFATGKLSGDNFNSVLENGGRITQALADGLGVSVLQLREMATTGQLQTGRVIEALTSQMQRLRQEAADMPATLRDGFTVLGNALQELLGAVDQASGGSASLGSILVDVADSIRSLARNTEGLRTTVIVITEIVKAAALIGTVILSFTLLGRAFTLLRAGVAAIIGAFAKFGSGVASIGKTLNWFVSSIRGITSGTIPAGKALEVLERRFGFLGKGIGQVVGALTTFGVAVFSAITGIKAYFSASDKLAEANDTVSESAKKAAEAERLRQEEVRAATAKALLAAQAQAQFAEALRQVTQEIGRQGRAFRENLANQIDNIRSQNEAINQSQHQIRLSQELGSLEKSILSERQRLQDALTDAIHNSNAASTADEDSKRRAAASIPLLQAAIENLNTQYKDQREAIEGLLSVQEQLTKARSLDDFAIRQQQSNADALLKIQRDIAGLDLSEIEKQYFEIANAADDAARAAIRAEEARRGTPLNSTEIEEYYARARNGVQQLQEQQQKLYESTRTFEAGWKGAFQSYADEATNAAKQAERIFQKTTQGMENMIVDFAKTGKFEFKSFVNSILETLLRSQVQQLIAQLFNIGGSGGGGGSKSTIGRLLGFANGGIIPTNSPVLVGERGPEIISGAAGRVVTPNNQIGGTTVVYNINAVDALSFKQLVARDPAFLYAVTQQGAKSIPQTRR